MAIRALIIFEKSFLQNQLSFPDSFGAFYLSQKLPYPFNLAFDNNQLQASVMVKVSMHRRDNLAVVVMLEIGDILAVMACSLVVCNFDSSDYLVLVPMCKLVPYDVIDSQNV